MSASIIVKFGGNLDDLKKAIAEGKVAIEQSGSAMDKLAGRLKGDPVIRQAKLWAGAIAQVGDATKLTAKEQERANQIMQRAIEVYQRAGKEVPADIRKIADATKHAARAHDEHGTSFGKMVSGYAAGLATFGAAQRALGGVVSFLKSSVGEYARSELAAKRLTAALVAQSTATPAVIAGYRNLQREFQRTTVYEDDLIAEMQTLLVEVGDVAPADMEKALRAATNLASGLGIDLRSAVMMLGKAYEGNTGALKKAGVVVDEHAVKARGMVAVLDAVNDRFAGQAAAELDTYSGRIKQLANEYGGLKEAIGGAITAEMTQRSGSLTWLRGWMDEMTRDFERLGLWPGLLAQVNITGLDFSPREYLPGEGPKRVTDIFLPKPGAGKPPGPVSPDVAAAVKELTGVGLIDRLNLHLRVVGGIDKATRSTAGAQEILRKELEGLITFFGASTREGQKYLELLRKLPLASGLAGANLGINWGMGQTPTEALWANWRLQGLLTGLEGANQGVNWGMGAAQFNRGALDVASPFLTGLEFANTGIDWTFGQAGKRAGTKWTTGFASGLRDVMPAIQRALEGGGNIGAAAGAAIAAEIAAKLLAKFKPADTEKGTPASGVTGGVIGAAIEAAVVGWSVGHATKSKAAGALTGAASGATTGFMVGGLPGAAIGGTVGFIAGLVGASNAQRDARRQAEREADATIGQLQVQLMKTWGSLDKIRAMGSLVGVALAEAWGDRSIGGLQHFQGVVDEFNTHLTKMLKGLQTAPGFIGKPLIELVNLAKDNADVQAALEAFLTRQTARTVSGLQGYVTAGGGAEIVLAREELIAAQKAREERIAAGDLEGAKLADAQIVKTQEKLKSLEAQAKQTTTAGGALALGSAAVAMWGELQAQGASPLETLQQLNPILVGLKAQFDAAGVSGGEAFEAIGRFAAFASDEITGKALNSVASLRDILIGTANTGYLTEEMFAGLGSQVAATYNALIAQGKDPVLALQGIQPTLQTLWEMQTDFGWAVDASTQLLIDQGLMAGTVGDKFRDPQDKMTKAVEGLILRLGDLIDLLTNGLEPAANRGADGVIRAIDRIPSRKTITIEYDEQGQPVKDQYGTPVAGPRGHAGGIAQRWPRIAIVAHGGLAPDEFPAILRAGEAVLNPQATSIVGAAAIRAWNRGQPVPVEACEACHAEIARTKSASHHVSLACTTCHGTQSNHALDPEHIRPDKPRTRNFCGQCHAEDAMGPAAAPKVDIATHGEDYLCWQCHYPHYPEAIR